MYSRGIRITDSDYSNSPHPLPSPQKSGFLKSLLLRLYQAPLNNYNVRKQLQHPPTDSRFKTALTHSLSPWHVLHLCSLGVSVFESCEHYAGDNENPPHLNLNLGTVKYKYFSIPSPSGCDFAQIPQMVGIRRDYVTSLDLRWPITPNCSVFSPEYVFRLYWLSGAFYTSEAGSNFSM